MAQLTDDCFAFSGPLLPVEEVERIINERIAAVADIESVPLRAACGRVLAAPIVAPMDLPPFDNSAVDGYAVRHADLGGSGESRLPIRDRVTAGHAASPRTRCRRGDTHIHRRADACRRRYRLHAGGCHLEGEAVVVPPGSRSAPTAASPARTCAPASLVLPAGRRLAAQHVALAAAIGLTSLPSPPRPRGGVLDRRRDRRAGLGAAARRVVRCQPLSAGRPASRGWAARHRSRHPAGRSGGACTRARRGTHTHDLVLTSGGVSTGEADHVRGAVEIIGRLVFWRLAIKPGRPVAMGVIPGAMRRRRCALSSGSRQSGRGLRDVRAGGAAAASSPRGGRERAARPHAGARRLRLPRRRGAVNTCGSSSRARPTARWRRSSTPRMGRASSRR